MHTNHFFVSNLTADAVVSGSYIIQDMQFCTTRTGTPYLRATLNDATGSIRMLFWDYDNSSTPLFDGAIVNINGTVGHYRGILQITAESLCLTDLGMLDQEDMDSLVPSAPIDVDACGKYVISLADNLKTAGLHDICDYLFYKHWDCFSSIPAAKSVHHAFLHGLLMHTADMAVAAETIITNNESYINRDLLIAGILLHDIGKILEFEISPVTGLVTGYTDKGNLLGHPVLGAMEIREAAETVGANPYLTMLLEHMILSHHGDPTAGAAKVPMTIEAELLHDLDKLDCRKQIYTNTLQGIQSSAYSAYVPALDHKVFQHGVTVPKGFNDSFSANVKNTTESFASFEGCDHEESRFCRSNDASFYNPQSEYRQSFCQANHPPAFINTEFPEM